MSKKKKMNQLLYHIQLKTQNYYISFSLPLRLVMITTTLDIKWSISSITLNETKLPIFKKKNKR